MARIKAESESMLLDQFERELRRLLPATWQLTAQVETRLAGNRRVDLILTVDTPDGSRGTILVEAKHTVEPATVPAAAAQLGTFAAALEPAPGSGSGAARVLLSNYLSPRSRELLNDAGIGWYDGTGNLKIELDRPALFLSRSGADRDPYPRTDERKLKSLKGPGAARVVRALLDGAMDTRVRALAEQAEVGAATSARVLRYLSDERLVERDERATVQRVHKRSLVQAWAREYGMTRTNHTTAVLAARGLDWVIDQLAEKQLHHVLTGSAALRRYLPEEVAPVSPLSLLTIYSDQVPALQRELRLHRVEKGANVLLLEPFDAVVLRGAEEAATGGIRYAAPSQTVADLLTSPGRGPEEAAQLIEALAERDAGWTL